MCVCERLCVSLAADCRQVAVEQGSTAPRVLPANLHFPLTSVAPALARDPAVDADPGPG